MKILLSAGPNTQQIVDIIHKKFDSSGDDLMVVPYIENINTIFQSGNYFDKAIIVEQSITHGGEEMDEDSIRTKLINFIYDFKSRGSYENFVFLTGDEDIANMIYEETFEIRDKSAIVFKQDKYGVKFFAKLITLNLDQLPVDIIFKPKEIEIDNTEVNMDEYSNQYNSDNSIQNDEFHDFDIMQEENNNQNNNDNFEEYDDNFNENDNYEGYDSNFEEYDDNFNENDNNFVDENYNQEELNGDEFNQDTYDDFNQDAFDNNDFEQNNYQEDYTGDSFEQEEYTGDPFEQEDYTGDTFEQEEYTGDTFEQEEYTDDNINQDTLDNNYEGDTFNQEYIDSDLNNQESINDNYDKQDLDYNYDNEDTEINNDDAFGDNFDDEFESAEDFNEDDFNSFDENDSIENDNDTFESFDDIDENQYSNDANTVRINLSSMRKNEEINNELYEQNNINQDIEENSEQLENDDNYNVNEYDENGYITNDYMNDYTDENQETYNNEEYTENNNNEYAENDYVDEHNDYVDEHNDYVDEHNDYVDEHNDYVDNPNNYVNNQNNYVNNQNNYANNQNNYAQGQYQQPITVPLDTNNTFRAFASRGNNICVTGCGGAGTSTVAFNIANILCNMGYNVLLVDFDTEIRTQNFISLNSYKSMEPSGSNLMAAINSSQYKNQTTIVKPGFHLLTMGIAGDATKPKEILNEGKISRFINLIKPMYNFVIYDVPFDSATGFLSEVVYLSDNLVLVTDMSTQGIMKMMLKVCNIENQDMQETFFNKAQLVFNKNRNIRRLLGKPVRSIQDITHILDEKLIELIGQDTGYYFSEMIISGVLNDDPDYELCWFEETQYSDTNKGAQIYKDLIERIILHR